MAGYLQRIARAVGGSGSIITASSGTVANASAVAALPSVTNRMNFITGFEVTSTGSTAATVVTITVTGVTNQLNYTYASVAGVLLINQALLVEFPQPVPASAVSTAITVTVPALGGGNTNATVNIHGYVV